MKYFLASGAGLRGQAGKFLFTRGSTRDCAELQKFLSKKYGGEAILCKNGRSGLALALSELLAPKSKVLINGFTCYAVVEAVLAAGCTPVYADITREDLNFDVKTLEKVVDDECKAVIVQNTLGNPVDMVEIEKFAKKHKLVIIEDLAHSAGVRYPDGREAGTVGVATVLSFGKEKMIDAVSGGAVVMRGMAFVEFEGVRSAAARAVASAARGDGPAGRAPRTGEAMPTLADTLRARFYPLFATIYRGLPTPLGKVWMGALLKIRWVERSADNKLDTTREIAPFEAKIALAQLKTLRSSGEKPLRTFCLVDNRDEALAELRENGYYFDGFWYEKPISPARYYKKAHFDEKACPVATEVAEKIINFPTHYSKKDLAKAWEIVRKTGVNLVENYVEKSVEKPVENRQKGGQNG